MSDCSCGLSDERCEVCLNTFGEVGILYFWIWFLGVIAWLATVD